MSLEPKQFKNNLIMFKDKPQFEFCHLLAGSNFEVDAQNIKMMFSKGQTGTASNPCMNFCFNCMSLPSYTKKEFFSAVFSSLFCLHLCPSAVNTVIEITRQIQTGVCL